MGYEEGRQLGYMLDSSVLVQLLMQYGRSGKSSSRHADMGGQATAQAAMPAAASMAGALKH